MGPDHPGQGGRGLPLRSRVRHLLEHPVVRSLLFERLLLVASGGLAAAALLAGRVRPAEVPSLLDTRLLSLFFVLTIAVELGKASDLFDRLVAAVAGRARSARGLACGMVLVAGALAAVLTNDVALFLVVPFTMLFRRVTDLDLAPVVVLEVAATNLIGCISPLGNPQNLFLYERGGFRPGPFFAAQVPWVASATLLLLAVVPRIVAPGRLHARPAEVSFDVHVPMAALCLSLLAAELASLFRWIPHVIPLALSVAGAVVLGRRLRETDFSLIFVFAFLFVGVAGLERGGLYRALDPGRFFGHEARGLVLSGALLSQFVSNVPAAMLLAPAAAGAAGFRALLYGVNAGGCGTPVASLANLIGAQLWVREGGDVRRFWRRFLPVSATLFLLLVGVSLVLVSI
jgi:Na+/H+ antiporter NhaD/arsenite permease-like protein